MLNYFIVRNVDNNPSPISTEFTGGPRININISRRGDKSHKPALSSARYARLSNRHRECKRERVREGVRMGMGMRDEREKKR